jgi:hypothetical protein
MPYLGKTPSQATRQRYYKTASGGETSLSGTMTTGGTLTFNDGEFVDVSVNGVALVAGTDYNTTTANTIGGLSALSANDQVEIVVYDTFSVFGGNVDGDFTINNGTFTAGTTSLDGAVTINESSADVDFRVESDGNANMLFVDAGNNRVGIGTNSPSEELHVSGQIMTEGTSPTLYLKETDTTDTNFQLRVASGTLRIQKNNDAFDSSSNVLSVAQGGDVTIDDGNLVLASGHGIDFSATANSSGTSEGELLDDYEVGQFTPTGATTSGTAATFSSVSGRYQKIGRMVTVYGFVVNVDTTGTTSTAQFLVGGLPFTPDIADCHGVCVYDQISTQGGRTQINVRADASADALQFMHQGNGIGETTVDNGDITSGTTDIFFQITYQTSQ